MTNRVDLINDREDRIERIMKDHAIPREAAVSVEDMAGLITYNCSGHINRSFGYVSGPAQTAVTIETYKRLVEDLQGTIDRWEAERDAVEEARNTCNCPACQISRGMSNPQFNIVDLLRASGATVVEMDLEGHTFPEEKKVVH